MGTGRLFQHGLREEGYFFFFCGTPFVLRYSHPCKPRSHIAFAKSQGAIKKFSLRKGQSGFQIFAHDLIFYSRSFWYLQAYWNSKNTAVGNICVVPYLRGICLMSFDNDVELRKVAAVYPEAQLLLRVVCEEGGINGLDWILRYLFRCLAWGFPKLLKNRRSD